MNIAVAYGLMMISIIGSLVMFGVVTLIRELRH